MNKNIFYYLQVLSLILVGFCGLTLLIGGICMSSIIPIGIGFACFAFAILIPVFDRK